MAPEVRNNEARRQFEITLDGKMAISRYRLTEGGITFLHTEVPKEFEGKGIGSALARHALEHARANNLKVTPLCPFIKGYIDRHPEYQGLLKGE